MMHKQDDSWETLWFSESYSFILTISLGPLNANVP